MDEKEQLAAASNFLRSVLGKRIDELVQAMLDHAVPPIFLDHDHPPPLRRIYEECVRAMRETCESSDARTLAGLRDMLPWHLEGGDLARGLIEAGTVTRYDAVPKVVLDPGDPGSRVFAALPDLYELLDGDGLLDCS